jgi:hypothetical protein
MEGPPVQRVRMRLLVQAKALGYSTTDCPDLHVLADGEVLRPQQDGDTYRFVLPTGARKVRLVSRTLVPAEIFIHSRDARRLGVAVTRMVLDGRMIALDDARLADGWHPGEPAWRWTVGDAALPCVGGGVLEIGITPAIARYWIQATDRQAERQAA